MQSVAAARPRVSVCMATYNGERFIGEQITSILAELSHEDELVVVDDCSSDATATLVMEAADPRIHLVRAPHNRGYVSTFEHALGLARGEYIFLSDQDDIWLPGRLLTMMSALEHSDVVVSNCRHFGGPQSFFHRLRLRAVDAGHSGRNLLGIVLGYRLHWGCAMALRSEVLAQVLPFPRHMRESHDQWIATVGNVNRSIVYLEVDTVLHRLHADNLTPLGIRSASAIVRARLAFIRNIFEACRRYHREKST